MGSRSEGMEDVGLPEGTLHRRAGMTLPYMCCGKVGETFLSVIPLWHRSHPVIRGSCVASAVVVLETPHRCVSTIGTIPPFT